jgi:hypothetical protein
MAKRLSKKARVLATEVANKQASYKQDRRKGTPQFACLETAVEYLTKLGYSYSESYNYKQFKTVLYKKRYTNKQASIQSSFDYVDRTSMQMGVVYTVRQW